ncbi:MAG: hypothetical protein SNI32_08345 [Rikenellaceae bacterium]
MNLEYKEYSFQLHNIRVAKTNIENTFSRYKKSQEGEKLLERKSKGDESYTQSLNPYGDRFFCKFSIDADVSVLQKRGIYCFVINGSVKYIGRCLDNFKKRFGGNGYGGISPKNCYKGGQSTNCHINSCINEHYNSQDTIQVGFHFIEDRDSIISIEKYLISDETPDWNIKTK